MAGFKGHFDLARLRGIIDMNNYHCQNILKILLTDFLYKDIKVNRLYPRLSLWLMRI
jgi:hypothetical protein